MSANGFPTVGLEFDLTKVDAGQQRLKTLREEYKGLGTDAAAAGQKVAEANEKIAGSGAAATSKLNTLSEARLKVARDATAAMEAEATKQQLLAQKTVSTDAAAAVERQRALQAFLVTQADLQASARARQLAVEAEHNAKVMALADRAMSDGNLMRVRQGVAELTEIEAQNARKLAMQRAYLDAQLRLTAEGVIAQQQAGMDAAAASYAALKARTDAADRATTGIATGAAGFAVSGDAQGMAASIAATEQALRAEAGTARVAAAAMADVATATTAATTATTAAAAAADGLRMRQAAQLSAQLGLTEAAGAATLAALQQGKSLAEAARVGQDFEQALAKAKDRAQALLGSLDPLIAAQQKFNRVQAEADELLALGALSGVEHARVMELAGASLVKAGVAAGGTALQMREMLVVVREFIRGDFTRMAGSMTILGQAFGVLTAQVLAAILPWTLLAVAIVGIAAAISNFGDEQRKLASLANGVGAAFGATAGQIEAAAEASAAANNVSIGAAEKWAVAYVKTGKIGGDVLMDLTLATKAWAEATGQKADQASQELARAFADPAKGAVDLNEKLHFLTQTEVEHIETMTRSGNLIGAQDELWKKFGERLEETATHANGLAAALKHILDNDLDTIRDIAKFLSGSGTPVADQIRSTKAELARVQNDPANQGYARELAERLTRLEAQGLNEDYARRTGADNAREGPGAKVSNGYDFSGAREHAETQANLEAAKQALDQARKTDQPKVADYQRTVDNLTVAYKQQQEAIDKGLSPAVMRQNLINEATDAKAKAVTNSQKAAAASALVYAQKFGQVSDQALLAAQAHGAYESALDRVSKTAVRHEASIQAQIDALGRSGTAALKAADAYLSEGLAAGDAAEATRKGIEKATRERMSQADANAYIQAQEDEARGRQIEGWAREATQLDAQTKARGAYNQLVADGVMSSQEAADALGIENALREKEEALIHATTEQRPRLIAEIERERAARERGLAVQRDAQVLADVEAQGRQLKVIELETQLIGAENGERARRIAMLQKELELRARYGDTYVDHNPQANIDIANAGRIGKGQADNGTLNEAHTEALNYQLTLLTAIGNQAGRTADQFAAAFGKMGAAIGGLAKIHADYNTESEAINRREQDAFLKYGDLAKTNADARTALDAAVIRSTDERQANEQTKTAAEFEAFKGLFDQKSAAYKVLQGVEAAYYAQQFILRAQSIAQDVIHTASTILHSGARSAVLGVEAVVRAIASMPFPLNLAAGAATAAAVAALGIGIAGAISGSNTNAAGASAADVQKSIGAGSVLGDASAKSESLSKALTLAEKYQDKSLDYSAQMVHALRNIENSIGSVAAAVAKTLGLSTGGLSTDGLHLGTTSSHLFAGVPILGLLGSLFGTSKTTTPLDQGLNFGSQSVASILGGGVNGETYQTTQTDSKTKFLGLTLSSNSRQGTANGALDPDLAHQLQLLIDSLRTGVLTAAGQLGLTGAQATVDAFVVNLGKISLKDLTTEEMQKELEAAFSKVADDLATTAAPMIAQFQKAGEGAFETLARLATDYTTLDGVLASIGLRFGAIGVDSLAAREGLIKLAGGLDTLVEQTGAYAEAFLSDAERMAPVQAAIVKRFQELGVVGVNTKDQFKALVDSLDLTTQAGQTMFAALMAIAPDFAKVFDFLAPDVKSAARSVSDLRQDLVDAYGREHDALTGIIASLKDFRTSLDTGANALLTPEAQYEASRTAFFGAVAKGPGDQEAMKALPSLGQDFLTASKAYFASSPRYFQDLGAVRSAIDAAGAAATQQLSTLEQQVQGLITINTSVISVRDAVVALQAALTAQALGGNSATPFSPLAPTPGYTLPGNDNAVNDNADWDSYLAHYADVLAEAQRQVAAGAYATTEAYAQAHYDAYGRAEGRTPYRNGGIIDRPMTLGEAGIGGEAGAEGILPLTRVGDRLGVHANVDRTQLDALIGETQAMRRELAAVNAQLPRVAESIVDAHDRGADKVAVEVRKAGRPTQRLRAGGSV
jgi:hypothetical protein